MPEVRIKRNFSSVKQLMQKFMLLKAKVTLASSVSQWYFTQLSGDVPISTSPEASHSPL